MSRLKPPLAFPLSRLIQAGLLILSLVGVLIPTRTAHADNQPPPLLPGGWRTFTTANAPIEPGEVKRIFEDSQGRVWIVTSEGLSTSESLSVYKDGIWQTFTEKDGVAKGGINAIIGDRAGRVWVGTSGGVSVYAGGAWQLFTEKDGLAVGGVYHIVEDHAGQVWIGAVTFPAGSVSVYAGGAWQTFTEKDGLAAGMVNTLLEDRAGRVWVGTSGGVSVYAGGAWQTFTEEDGLAAGEVNTILGDHAGRVWVGTSGGVSVYAGRIWQTFAEKDGLVAGEVNIILEDRAGRVWVGTSGGVSVYAGGAWQTFTEKDGLAAGDVNIILEDHAGRVWIGTSGGVSVYAGKTWQTFTEKDGLAAGGVNTLLEDRAGRVWVGMGDYGRENSGVSMYAGGVWQTFTEKDGLAAGGVTTILEDRAGRVWVGTSGGVSMYTGEAWQTFTDKDGLAAHWVNAILEDRAGRVWVGASGGVSVKWPHSDSPWAFVQAIAAWGQTIGHGKNVVQPRQAIGLPADSYRLRLDFSGSDMDSRQDNVFFRYRLEGHEQEWHVTKSREAQYTDLGPGDYTFVVKSVDEDALESPPATLRIHIERFWWQSPFVWAGGAVGFVLLIFGAVWGTRSFQRRRQLDAWRKGHDPYIVGAVIEEPDKFYGREETLTELMHALEAGNHMALYGERRIGKTSLLHQLAHRLSQAPNLVPVFVELQGVLEERFFFELMRAVAKAVRERADAGQLAIDSRPERYTSEDMADDLDMVLSALKDKLGDLACVVLLLDEADAMNSYNQLVQERLRGLLVSKEFSRYVKLVWSGQQIDRNWKLNTSPWYNLFKREIHLGGIERDAAVRLIRQPVKGVYEYDDAAVNRILEYSDSKPYLIQRLCSACVRRLLDTRRSRVTVDDVDAAHQVLEAEYRQESTEPSAPARYQVAPLAHQVAEKKADYKKDDAP